MKNTLISLLTSQRTLKNSRLIPVLFLSLCAVAACQKTPESDNQAEADNQNPPVAISTDDKQVINKVEVIGVNTDETSVDSDQKTNLDELENDIGSAAVVLNPEDGIANPEQAIKGTQITDVKYRSAAGDSLSVIFETSAAGTLDAIVTLPNKPQVTLSAPEGQGNNPTYRSTDGSMELISHGGGSTIDLRRDNKVTSFDAISADAEVIRE